MSIFSKIPTYAADHTVNGQTWSEWADELFEFEFQRSLGPWADYGVTSDGKRFLMIQPTRWDPRQLNLITNFTVQL